MLPWAHPAFFFWRGLRFLQPVPMREGMSTAIPSLPSAHVSGQTIHKPSPDLQLVGLTAAVREVEARGEVRVGVSAVTELLRAQMRGIGPHFRTALITGERGARKEEVARALHAASPTASGAFVVCDSGWMESLLRGEGAVEPRIYAALVKAAQGGTVFFPELGLFSGAAQTQVLRFLERLGAEHGKRVRVIASVSGDVEAMVAGGTLRPELRDRIGTIELVVAPLRERLEDIHMVASRILEQASERCGGVTAKISDGALKELQRRGWPGNDRELESTLRMAALACDGGVIEEQHLPAATPEEVKLKEPAVLSVSSMRLQDVVEAHVQEVLRRCEGNKLKAAEVLGISRSTLYRMLDAASVAA